ncbi:type II secretion system protein GspM [Rhizosaccharibacter radicis]|uniref:Type II secretion system protein GspM n=1 Tax=Rhizosaccharibacter radicis TaxID=2782605 RepID=A0ABT1VT46_9PROT|nr:type II secretion system protein GspM [Acetobacteraceae bacterium KSS12]
MTRARGLAGHLPEGRNGRLLALALGAVVVLAVWNALLLPVIDWYGARSAGIERQTALLERERSLAARLPALRAQVRRMADGHAAAVLMGQSSDTLAAASLQERVQTMAGSLGVSLSSTESLPAAPAGPYRRIGMRVSLSARYDALVRLLAAIEKAEPAMLVDDLQLHGARLSPQADSPLEAAFTVLAFRLASPGDRSGSAAPDGSEGNGAAGDGSS